MNKTESEGPNPFRTLDANGKPVMSRFSSARTLLEVYNKLQDEDAKGEAPRRAKIRKMYDGYRPWDPAKLEAAGIKDRANVNCGGLAGQIDARAGGINDMALDTTNLIELRAIQAEMAGPDAELIGDVVSEEFSAVLREGQRFLPAVATMVKETDLYGLGPVTWRDPFDYQLVALERGQVKFPSEASAISSENELIMVETVLPAWYMFQLFDDPEASAAAGWNLPAVKAYLVSVFRNEDDNLSQSQDEMGTSAVESVWAMFRQNRTFEVKQFNSVRVINAYVREVGGDRKISHYMTASTDVVDEFLFKNLEAYDDMNQCVMWLPYSATERYARSLRGMASKLILFEDLRNRNFCKIVDAASRAASMKLKATSLSEGVRNTIVEQGPYTFYTGGVEPVATRVDPDFQQLASVNELIGRLATNNALGASGPAAAPERIYSGADRKTKDQIAVEASAGAKSEQALFVLRSMVFDALFRECFRRFMKLVLDPTTHDKYEGVKKFLERCKLRGVEREHLRQIPKFFTVYMCRDLVTGGAGAKAGILSDIIGLGGNLDEAGRISATHDYIKCRAGVKAADRYRPMIGRDAIPSDAASHAIMENNDMFEGAAALVGVDQLHWSHIPIHAQLLDSIAQSVQAGQVEDPSRMLNTLQVASEHVQQHVLAGGRQLGKEDDAKKAIATLRGLRPIVQALTMMAESQQKEQEAEAARQEQEMADLRAQAQGKENEIKMHEADNRAAVEMYKVDRMHEARMTGEYNKAQADAFRARSKATIDRISRQSRMMIEAGKITGRQPPEMSALGGEEPLAMAGRL